MAKKSKRLTQTEQSARFVEIARKLEADERPEEFDKAFKKIAPSKASQQKKA
jgi:hypothetical protein